MHYLLEISELRKLRDLPNLPNTILFIHLYIIHCRSLSHNAVTQIDPDGWEPCELLWHL